MNNSEQPKKAMIKALRKSIGNVSTDSQMAGVGRTTHYDWMKTNEKYDVQQRMAICLYSYSSKD